MSAETSRWEERTKIKEEKTKEKITEEKIKERTKEKTKEKTKETRKTRNTSTKKEITNTMMPTTAMLLTKPLQVLVQMNNFIAMVLKPFEDSTKAKMEI